MLSHDLWLWRSMSGDLFLVIIFQVGLTTPIHASTVFSMNLIPLTVTYDLHSQIVNIIYTHTHTRLTALCPGLPRWAGTIKVKPILILLKQETVSGSGISWAICKSAPCSRQTTTPAPTTLFLQAGCPSCRPTNSVKVLKANSQFTLFNRINICRPLCSRVKQ